jgi:8-oxo-dGTP diphosphatase
MMNQTQSEPGGMPAAIPVAVVAIARRIGTGPVEILLTRRAEKTHLGGFWALPGGKIRSDETPAEAASREIREETGLACRSLTSLVTLEHSYPDRIVRLHAFTGWLDESNESDMSILQSVEHEWIAAEDLGTVRFPAANTPITAAIINRYGSV